MTGTTEPKSSQITATGCRSAFHSLDQTQTLILIKKKVQYKTVDNQQINQVEKTICLSPRIAYLVDSGEEHMGNDHLKSTREYQQQPSSFHNLPPQDHYCTNIWEMKN